MMADVEDFEFDEHGIYRDKQEGSRGNGDQGILVDEDGIWRDDGFTYTDSGFGGNTDRKSSSSTLNKVADAYDQETESFRLLPPHIRNEIGYEDDFEEGSLLADEKSLNISELEASESVAGDFSPFDAQSLGSGAPYDFPELHDESYMIDSGASRHDSHPGHEGSTSTYSRRESELSHLQEQDYQSDSSHESDERYFEGEEDAPKKPLTKPLRESLPPVTGDSIFSQEGPPRVPQQLSLMEFEQLEAAVLGSDAEITEHDLIGAYLQGLKDQDEADEEGYLDDLQHEDDVDGVFDHPMHRTSTGKMGQSPHNDQYWSDQSEGEDQYNEGRDLHNTRSSRKSGFTMSSAEGTGQYGSSIAFEDNSLIENQQPPFGDSIPFSTGEMTGGRDDEGRPNSRNNTPKASRIPMLRSRSPSLSRPGSSLSRPGSISPSRGRSVSPGLLRNGTPSPTRLWGSRPGSAGIKPVLKSLPIPTGVRSRSLPPTPQRNEPVIGLRHPPKETQVEITHRPHSSEPESDLAINKNNVSFQSEVSDMEKATTLLFGEDDQTDDYGLHYMSAMELTHDRVQTGELDIRPSSAEYTRSQVPKVKTKGAKTQNGQRESETKQYSELMLSQLDELAEQDQGLSQQSARSERTTLKSKLNQESEQRQMHEETLNQLQIEYNTLLKKYAEAENTIDELRLGAKVTLYAEGAPVSGQAQTGTMPPAQHPQAFSISQRGTASYTSGGVGSIQGSRPDSRASQAGSASLWLPGVSGGSGNQAAGSIPPLSRDETSSLAEEGAKLSLLAKAKAAEDQITAFQILLDENHLSLEDQDKALQNIKDGMEKLQQDYRDAKEENEFMRRQGLSNGEEPDVEFDENKDVEGELYKLNMKLDDLEHRVQGNLKQKSTRVPYKGPVKADHSINVPAKATSTPVEDLDGTPHHRPPSVCSMTGSSGEIDEKLQRLNKDYSDLMGRYRQLKQRRKTPERDEVINNLLKQLRNIYEETPEDRRPTLPVELENQFKPVEDYFVDKDNIGKVAVGSPKSEQTSSLRYSGRGRPDVESRNRPERTLRESRETRRRETRKRESPKGAFRDDSDLSSSPERGSNRRLPSSGSTSEYTSGMSIQNLDRRKRQQPKENVIGRESVESGRRSDSHRRLPRVAPKRRDLRDDKDSGYVGSESSRKTGTGYSGVGGRTKGIGGRTGDPGTSGVRRGGNQTGPKRTNALGEPRAEYYSDSDSGSSADTVEEKRYTKASANSSKADGGFQRGEFSIENSRQPDGHQRKHHSPRSTGYKRRSSQGSAGHRSADRRSSRHGSSSDEEVRTISEGRHSSSSDPTKNDSRGNLLPQRQYLSSGAVTGNSAQPNHPLVVPQPLQLGVPPTQGTDQVAGQTGIQPAQYYYYPTGYQFDTGVPNVYGAQNGQQPNATPNGQVYSPQQMPHNGYRQVEAVEYAQEQNYQAGGGPPSRYIQTQGQPVRESQRESNPAYQGYRRNGEYDSWDPKETWARDDYYSQDPYQENLQGEEDYTYGETPKSATRYRTKHRPNRQATSYYEENEPTYRSGYQSDPDMYKDSSRDRYSRLKDYYAPTKTRSRQFSPSRQSRGASKPSHGYTDYENPYTADSDKRRLSSQREGYSSQGTRDLYNSGPGMHDSGTGIPDVYGGVMPESGYGASGLSSHQHTGIQNVPHMQHQGSQYLPPPASDLYSNGAAGQSGYPYNGGQSQVTFAVPLTQQNQASHPGTFSNATYEQPGAASGSYYAPSGSYYTPSSQLLAPGGATWPGTGTSTVSAPQLNVQQPGIAYTVLPQGNTAPTVYETPTALPGTYGPMPGLVGSVAGQGTSAGQKVRYYIREYGAEDSRNKKDKRSKSQRVSAKKYIDSDNENESDDLDSSLNKALETSKQLKKMSRRMKRTLNEELESSYREAVHGY